jgi:hypothetical protein
MKSKRKNQYLRSLKIVNQIQQIRSKNNKNWMDLLKLSLKLDPKKTTQILGQIYSYDQKISILAKKIIKIK